MFSISKFHFTFKLKIKGQISAKKSVSDRQLIVTVLQAVILFLNSLVI